MMKIIKPLDMRNFLYSLVSNKGRLIGLDVGKLSMGVSMSDSHLQVAEPLRIISRNAKEGVIPANIQLHNIISTYGISGFVVGLPTYKLRKTDATLIVEAFVNGLAKTGDFSNLNICYWDAVGTSKNARLLLDPLKLSHTELKDICDKLAAAGILQGFLDFYNNPSSKPWVGLMESDSE